MTQAQDPQLAAEQIKTSSRILIYLVEELGDARLRAAQLKRYVQQATDLIEKSPERDHLFEVAAHLIHGIPQTLFKLEKALDASAMATARLDYEEIRQGLRPEKSDELDEVMEDTRLRCLKRRSDGEPMTPKEAATHLLQCAAKTEAQGYVPTSDLLSVIASLEAEQQPTDDLKLKAAEVFRQAAKTIIEDPKPSRVKLAGLLRRVLADTMQPMASDLVSSILTQASSREDVMKGFKEANPDLTDDQLKEIADQWEKNRDVVKDKTAADDEQEKEKEKGKDGDKDEEKGKPFPGAAPPFGKDKKAARYGGDPHWITAKYPGVAEDGTPFKKGERVLYWPNGKIFMIGPKAEAAMKKFEAEIADEAFYSYGRAASDKTAENPDFKGVAKELLDKNRGTSQDDLHYRAYLRAVMQGQPAQHLTEKFPGAKKALDDLIDEAGKAPKKASDKTAAVAPEVARAFKEEILPQLNGDLKEGLNKITGSWLDKLTGFEEAAEAGKLPNEGIVYSLIRYKANPMLAEKFFSQLQDALAHWHTDVLKAMGGGQILSASENEDKDAGYAKGEHADPTENMSEEVAKKWKAMNEEHGDKFKKEAWGHDVTREEMAKGLFSIADAMYGARVDPRNLADRIKDSEERFLLGVGPFQGVDHLLVEKAGKTRAKIRSWDTQTGDIAGDLEWLARELKKIKTATENEDKQSRFEEGKPADPTENMSPEDAAEWKAMNEEHGDKFKKESAELMSWQSFELASSKFQSALDTFAYAEDPESNGRGWTNLSKGLMVLASFFEGLLQVASGHLEKAARLISGSPRDATLSGYQHLEEAYKSLSDASRLAKSDNIDGSFKKLAESMAHLGKMGLEARYPEFARLVDGAGAIFRRHEGPLSKTAADPKWDKNKAKQWMLRHINDYVDHMTGEVNYTGLAEGAASEFDIYGPPPTYDIPEGLFDLSIDVGEIWEKKQKHAATDPEDKQSRFEEGKPADPTENMSPEDASEWKAMNEEHGDKFKTASDWGARELKDMEALLKGKGYDPKDAQKLQKEGMGTYELEDRLKKPGDLERTHGLKKEASDSWKVEARATDKDIMRVMDKFKEDHPKHVPGKGYPRSKMPDFMKWLKGQTKDKELAEGVWGDLFKGADLDEFDKMWTGKTASDPWKFKAAMPRITEEEILAVFHEAGLSSLGTRYGKAGEFWGIRGSGRAISVGRREILANAFYIQQELLQDGRFPKPDTRWNNVNSELLSKLTVEKLQKWAQWAKQGSSTEEMYKVTREACKAYVQKMQHEGKEVQWPIRALYQASWKSGPSVIGD